MATFFVITQKCESSHIVVYIFIYPTWRVDYRYTRAKQGNAIARTHTRLEYGTNEIVLLNTHDTDMSLLDYVWIHSHTLQWRLPPFFLPRRKKKTRWIYLFGLNFNNKKRGHEENGVCVK